LKYKSLHGEVCPADSITQEEPTICTQEDPVIAAYKTETKKPKTSFMPPITRPNLLPTQNSFDEDCTPIVDTKHNLMTQFFDQ
jgi:hypothetical protein